MFHNHRAFAQSATSWPSRPRLHWAISNSLSSIVHPLRRPLLPHCFSASLPLHLLALLARLVPLAAPDLSDDRLIMPSPNRCELRTRAAESEDRGDRRSKAIDQGHPDSRVSQVIQSSQYRLIIIQVAVSSPWGHLQACCIS